MLPLDPVAQYPFPAHTFLLYRENLTTNALLNIRLSFEQATPDSDSFRTLPTPAVDEKTFGKPSKAGKIST